MQDVIEHPGKPGEAFRQKLDEKLLLDVEVLLGVAEDVGTPTYVYSEAVLRERCRALRNAFGHLPVDISYAMKANGNPAILKIMQEEGLGLDVVSPGELALAYEVGFESEKILFSANNMTDTEMREAHTSGALLNIGEMSRLERYAEAYPGGEVCLRINPFVGGGHHKYVVTASDRSKFGIPIGELPDACALARKHNVCVVGLHQHIGSGIMDAGLIWQAMQVMLRAARQISSLEFINFGGGFGIPYLLSNDPLDLDELCTLIEEPLIEFAREHPAENLRFKFEPGRYLVAESGVLLMRVNTIKEVGERCFAGCDTGMGHLMRPAVYDAEHLVYNISNPGGLLHRYDVTGNICEAGDVFAEQQWVQEISEGDLLAILDAGAYGMSMASSYNLRPLPAEVLVESDFTHTLIRRRQTPADLAQQIMSWADNP